jgi:hypothetical protein
LARRAEENYEKYTLTEKPAGSLEQNLQNIQGRRSQPSGSKFGGRGIKRTVLCPDHQWNRKYR